MHHFIYHDSMIRLFVSDIDGTLVNERSEFEEETIEAIRDFQKQGGIFMTATGRNTWELPEITSKVDNVILNCANGSILCEEDGTEILSYELDEDKVSRFYEFGAKHDLIMQFHCRDVSIIHNDMNFFKSHAINAIRRDSLRNDEEALALFERIYISDNMIIGCPLKDILKHDILKLEYLFLDPEEFETYFPVLQNSFSDCSIAEKTFLYNIEFSNERSDKGRIIQEYCRIKEIDEEEVAVIGDSGNDLSMIKLFKNSYAMGNASIQLKQAAMYQADDNAHLGVCKVLRKIIEENRKEKA